MLPLDPSLLLLLKFFVVLTCVAFWIQLLFNAIMGNVMRRRYYSVGSRRSRREGGSGRPNPQKEQQDDQTTHA